MIEFIDNLISLLFNVIKFLGSSLIDGLNFFISTFVTVPLYILELFNELPPIFKIGISGIFGLLLLVVFLKIVSLLFIR